MRYEDLGIKFPIKKYIMDESKTWEERYRQLESHHSEESMFLIKEIGRLKTIINFQVDLDIAESARKGYDYFFLF